LRAHVNDLHSAINEAGRRRRTLPWREEPENSSSLIAARAVMEKLEKADNLVRSLEESLREAQDRHGILSGSLRQSGAPVQLWQGASQLQQHDHKRDGDEALPFDPAAGLDVVAEADLHQLVP
jgi:hypothetical protein